MAQTGTVLVETATSFPPQMTSLLLPLESLMASSLASINVNVRLGFCFSFCVHFFCTCESVGGGMCMRGGCKFPP